MNTCFLALMLSSCCLAQVAVAGDLPARKPGLWQITRSPPRPTYPPQVQKICLDAATDALLYKVGTAAGHQSCSKVDIHRDGNKVEVNSLCKFGSSQSTSRSVMTLHGDTSYHEDIAVHFDPPIGKMNDSHSTKDATWLGSCPVDMKPGDIVTQPSALMPMPLRMNVRDMLNETK